MAPPPTKKESASRGDGPAIISGDSLSFLRTVATRNKLVLTFCVLAFIAVTANIKLILDVSGLIPGHQVPHTVTHSNGPRPETAHAGDLTHSMRSQLSVLLGIMVACLGAMIYLFLSRVIFPLNSIMKAANEMANGNLSVTAPARHGDEVGELGHLINNVAINFQEILLLTGTAVGNSHAAVENIQRALEQDGNLDRKDLKEQVTALKKDLEMLGEVVKDFQFYQTRFDGQKVVSQRSRTDG
jgi:HAMP domain-containing protein